MKFLVKFFIDLYNYMFTPAIKYYYYQTANCLQRQIPDRYPELPTNS